MTSGHSLGFSLQMKPGCTPYFVMSLSVYAFYDQGCGLWWVSERVRALEAPHAKEEEAGSESSWLRDSVFPHKFMCLPKSTSAGSYNCFKVLAIRVPIMIRSRGPNGAHSCLPASNSGWCYFPCCCCRKRLSVEEELLTSVLPPSCLLQLIPCLCISCLT